jgi:hypothetical protein
MNPDRPPPEPPADVVWVRTAHQELPAGPGGRGGPAG